MWWIIGGIVGSVVLAMLMILIAIIVDLPAHRRRQNSTIPNKERTMIEKLAAKALESKRNEDKQGIIDAAKEHEPKIIAAAEELFKQTPLEVRIKEKGSCWIIYEEYKFEARFCYPDPSFGYCDPHSEYVAPHEDRIEPGEIRFYYWIRWGDAYRIRSLTVLGTILEKERTTSDWQRFTHSLCYGDDSGLVKYTIHNRP